MGAVPDESTCVMVEGLSKECCHRCSLSAFGELGEEAWVGVEGRLLVTERLQLCPHQISQLAESCCPFCVRGFGCYLATSSSSLTLYSPPEVGKHGKPLLINVKIM